MGIQDENNQECLVMGKGVAFGKKVGQTVPVTAEAKVYSLKEMTERGDAKDILKSVLPLCLEFANEVLNQAEQEFGKVDRTILFTMADHLDFAIRRIQNGEQISNPLTDDIRVMFYKEYKVASCIQELLKEKMKMFPRQWRLPEQSANVFHLLRKKLENPLMSCLWDIID